MIYTIEPMCRQNALKVVEWKYSAPYDFYNMDNDEDSLNELLNGSYLQMLDASGLLIGFCCFGVSAQVPDGMRVHAYPADGSLDIGVGMKPDLTGNGAGAKFVGEILRFAEASYDTKQFRLTVAAFNERAIRLYRNLGFVNGIVFPAGDVEFMTMQTTNKK